MKQFVLGAFAIVLMTSCTGQLFEPGSSGGNSGKSGLKTITDLDQAVHAGRYDYVIKHGKRYLEEYPESDQAWNMLGWAYAKTDNLDKATECFEKVLSINQSSDNAYVGLGSVYRRAGDNDKARECYAEAIRITPKNAEALSSLLVIELLEGRYDEAVACGEKAWKYNKALGSIPANLCIAYHYQGNTQKRDYFYEKAKELDYAKMDGLDEILAGNVVIGDPPSDAGDNGEQ